jgi:3'-phosphoadenosine 5'-phosphosulfate sulfotransferase (PAPS reductase)/FAD synthetase
MREMDFSAIRDSEKPIFFCSFGKDSSCILHALKPYLDRIMVVFVDCGGLYPDIVEWAAAHGAMMPNFMYVHAIGDIWQYIKEKGWSVDIEIADLGRHGNLRAENEVAMVHKLQPYTQCIHDRFWIPMAMFANLYRGDCLITGERKQDREFATDWEARGLGMKNIVRPIFDWTDDDIWEYVDANNIELSKTFQGRQKERRDCYLCMGHEMTSQRIVDLKNDWPELYHRVFIEHGFKDVVPEMVRHLRKNTQVWEEIEKIISEPSS